MNFKMCGDTGNRDPQRPPLSKQNLPPAVQPRFDDDSAEKGLPKYLPTKKEGAEYSVFSKAQPNATVKASSFVFPEDSLRFLECLSLREKC